ncbi:MAG: hypothetical protein Q9222_001371 [Ikaeria aurantiellina]
MIRERPEDSAAAFSTYGEMQQHIRQNHPPVCDICGLLCSSQRELKTHVEIRHGTLEVDRRKTHLCPESGCGRAFTKKGNLNVHIQSVHRSRKFVCGEISLQSLNRIAGWDGRDACGKGLSTKGSLENHIRTSHMGMGRRNRKASEKKRHVLAEQRGDESYNLLKLTGMGYEESTGRHIACLIPDCSFRFGRMHDLQCHLVSKHDATNAAAIKLINGSQGNDLEAFPSELLLDAELAEDWQPMHPQRSGSIEEQDSDAEDTMQNARRSYDSDEVRDDEWLYDQTEIQRLLYSNNVNVSGLGRDSMAQIDPVLV